MSIVLSALIVAAPVGGWFNDPAAKIQRAIDLQDVTALNSVTKGQFRIKDGALEYNISGESALARLKGCTGKIVNEPGLNTPGHILWICVDQASEINQCLDVGYDGTMEPMNGAYLVWLSRWDHRSQKRCGTKQP